MPTRAPLRALSQLSRPAAASTPITGTVWRLASTSARTETKSDSSPATASSSSQPEASSSRLQPSSSTPTKRASSSAAPAKEPTGLTNRRKQPVTVPPLSRPLGVPRPPSSVTKTWTQKKDEMLDEERHKAKRKALMKEASQGYFHDFGRAQAATGGKLWVAPPVLIREDRALYFPDISGKSLLGEKIHTTDLLKGKVTLLSILSTRISEEHVLSYTSSLLPDWIPSSSSADAPGSSNIFQHVQINHQVNPLKSMLLSFFISSLKRTIPEEGWGRYIVSGGEWSHFDIDGPLNLENKLIGYIFLIDPNLKVRWAASGPAREEEVESLRKATGVLMKRATEQQQAL